MEFHVAATKPVEEFLEAKAVGLLSRPVLLGPVSLTLLGKIRGADRGPAAIATALVEVYADVLKQLASAGAAWVQVDEPCLCLDLPPAVRELFGRIYKRLASSTPGIKVLIATYFSDLRDTWNWPSACR
jgi:5-methyltetrahydropteroyltriglutamate--homocysteine methyltransferase